ncbi:MAG: hypothetical protein R3Y32_07730 [Bacillota bacterium]
MKILQRNFGYFTHKNIAKTTKIVDVHGGDSEKRDAQTNAKADVKADVKADIKTNVKADEKTSDKPSEKTSDKPKQSDAVRPNRKENCKGQKTENDFNKLEYNLYQVEKSPFEIMNTTKK